MLDFILQSVLGSPKPKKDEERGGIGSLLVIGIVLFVLLGGLKLLQKPEEPEPEIEECP